MAIYFFLWKVTFPTMTLPEDFDVIHSDKVASAYKLVTANIDFQCL